MNIVVHQRNQYILLENLLEHALLCLLLPVIHISTLYWFCLIQVGWMNYLLNLITFNDYMRFARCGLMLNFDFISKKCKIATKFDTQQTKKKKKFLNWAAQTFCNFVRDAWERMSVHGRSRWYQFIGVKIFSLKSLFGGVWFMIQINIFIQCVNI